MGFKETKLLGFLRTGPNDGKVFARKIVRVYQGMEEDVQTEAENLNTLKDLGNHAHIVRVEAHGWLAGAGRTYFIDMELADFTLDHYVNYLFRNEALPSAVDISGSFNPVLAASDSGTWQRLHTMWTIGQHISDGLKFMHEGGLVHRDLKTQNGTPYLIPRNCSSVLSQRQALETERFRL
jgi:serine/threonine protein kinase